MNLQTIQQATLAAREATGMPGIGTRVERGLWQVVLYSHQGRKTIVDPLSGWVSARAAVDTLGQIAADKGFRQ